ncbi:MAG TPA: M48 family metallopeptidase [Acidobacteriota bacterium]|nr:M48 family metallopeptidase [Acidobacteriota bacterium]
MPRREYMKSRLVVLSTLILLLTGVPLAAQTEVEPGFNLFSPQQDVEIGRQSAQEVEQQLPMLDSRRVQQYVDGVGQRLVRNTPGPDYPYQFKVVNSSQINAFALPGGFMYINRGLIEAASSEAELAGVMAHEISHVALRHGTNQASKAYLAQAGLGLLGGLLGDGGSSGQIIQAVGGFGLNTLFLKFSRSAEKKADILGAQILANAGYDPMEMVDFFETLRRQGGDVSGIEQFFSSHPSPENRAERVREEVQLIGQVRERRPVGGFSQIQNRLEQMPEAPAPQRAGDSGQGTPGQIERPSSRFETYRADSDLFAIGHPENWKAFPNRQGTGVTIVPQGGVVQTSQERQDIIYGVIVSHYDPFADRYRSRRSVSLRDATEDLVHQLLRSNSYLEVDQRSLQRDRLDGNTALSLVLEGISPVTRQSERVTLFSTRLEDGHILYFLFIAPESDYRSLGSTFERMLSSVHLHSDAGHASTSSR